MIWENIETRVVEAYKERNLRATSTHFRPVVRDGQECCCALGALYGAQVPDTNYITLIAVRLGVSEDDAYEFVFAFDRGINGREPQNDRGEASAAGQRTAEAVIAAGLRA